MSEPTTDDGLREALAEALFVHHPISRWGAKNLADALLPVVRTYADQHAAEELRYRADLIEARAYDETVTTDEATRDALSDTAAWLSARASSLAAREREA